MSQDLTKLPLEFTLSNGSKLRLNLDKSADRINIAYTIPANMSVLKGGVRHQFQLDRDGQILYTDSYCLNYKPVSAVSGRQMLSVRSRVTGFISTTFGEYQNANESASIMLARLFLKKDSV